MLILLEGCDGAGKTTLATELVETLGADLLHKGPMTADAITEYEDPLEDYLPLTNRHVICDRWHVGELVYGPLLRGESRVSPAEFRHIDMFLAKRGAVIAHMTAPGQLLRERIGIRGDDLIEQNHVDTIVDAYHHELMTNVHRLATTVLQIGPADDPRVLMTVGQVMEMRAAELARFETYVGPHDPGTLLLGERRKVPTDSAAFVPRPATSGAYLLDALPSELVGRIGIANALEENLPDLWAALGMPRVVALGREAQRECRVAEIPHGAVPHPQYVRRFHHNQSRRYARAIREAALWEEDLSGVFTSH